MTSHRIDKLPSGRTIDSRRGEAHAKRSKLDQMADKAIADHHAGLTTPLFSERPTRQTQIDLYKLVNKIIETVDPACTVEKDHPQRDMADILRDAWRIKERLS